MNKIIYLLFDSPPGRQQKFISQRMDRDFFEIYSPKSKKQIIGWVKGCLMALKQSKHDDIIVCWYDFQAILCYWMCKFSLKRRKIVCVNLLLKDKDSFKNSAAAWLYKNALNSKDLVASVTSKEYGEHLRNRLGIKRDFFLLHDVYHESYRYYRHVKVKSNTVFCGGRNGRDWRFMVDVGKAMPNVEFHLVMPKSTYLELKNDMPRNVIAKYNLSMDDFMREMCSSEIVALPLDTEAPAGLIVLFQAAANMKYIITTDTMTTREYVSNDRGCLVSNDIGLWEKAIENALYDKSRQDEGANNLYAYLRDYCNETIFVNGIKLMMDALNV